MNMYLHELKAYRKSTIIWSCTLVLVVLLFLSMYPVFYKDATDFRKLLEDYPESVRKAFGISLDSFFTLLGYYSYMFLYVLLCAAIQAMNLGTSILSKEVREKTADFLLTKPVTRKQIVTAKLLAVVTSLVITDIIYFIAASLMALIVKQQAFNYRTFFMISITVLFVQLMFMSLGILVSVVVPKIKSVLPISLATVFGFYIMSMFSSVIGDTTIRYITPFKYFDTTYIIKNSSYETRFLLIELVFIISSISISYLIYSKKDIHAV